MHIYVHDAYVYVCEELVLKLMAELMAELMTEVTVEVIHQCMSVLSLCHLPLPFRCTLFVFFLDKYLVLGDGDAAAALLSSRLSLSCVSSTTIGT